MTRVSFLGTFTTCVLVVVVQFSRHLTTYNLAKHVMTTPLLLLHLDLSTGEIDELPSFSRVTMEMALGVCDVWVLHITGDSLEGLIYTYLEMAMRL